MLDVQKEWTDDQIRRRDEEGPKPTAFGTPFRVSDAKACIRKRTLSGFGAIESDEFSSQTYMAFEIGNAVHASIQAALECDGNGWYFESEVPLDLTEVSKKVGLGVESFALSGHCDGIITNIEQNTRTILEIKTVSGYAAKLAWSNGPKREHIAQAGLYALGAEADSILIVYVAKEGDWRAGIKAGDMRQWEYGLHEIHPDGGQSVYDIAMDELRHFQIAARYYAKDQIAPCYVPDDNGELQFVEERPGYMQKGGKPWNCVYCSWNTTCQTLSADEVSVDLIERISNEG